MLVSLSGVTFGYASREIFRDLTFQVNPKEHVGVIGPNGHGKSTLLRLVAGLVPIDTGERSVRRGVSIGYLRQSQEFPGDVSVHDLLLQTFPEILSVERRLADVQKKMEAGDAGQDVLDEYGELQHRFEELDGYALEARVEALASEVGFTKEDLGRPAGSLSGGERSRFEIARVLLREPDVLLLDEPTNHLDLLQTERMERRLADYPGSFLLVSHDRAFLRATCDVMLEVERQTAVRYAGGYDSYRTQRDERLKRALDEYVRQNEKVEKTEDFIRRNIAGQKTKQAQARRKMLEKLERVERPEDVWEAARHLGIRFERGDHPGGKEIIKTKDLTVGYDGREPLIADFDWVMHRGDRVGLVGPNGAGKTTLVRALLGELKPLAGHVELGFRVSPGMLDQKLGGLDERATLIEEVRRVRPDLTIEEARSVLGRYRFLGEIGFQTVGGLSGGERCRLSLLKLSLEPHNLLVLDEPTNHLDIPAQETLERALKQFDGTILVVSHDREFLDSVVRRILWVEGGEVRVFEGNWSAARRELARKNAPSEPEVKKAKAKPATAPAKPSQRQRAQSRGRRQSTQKDRNRLKTLEKEISELETRSEQLTAALSADPDGDWEKVHKLANEEQEVRARLDRRVAEWERVSTRLEREGA